MRWNVVPLLVATLLAGGCATRQAMSSGDQSIATGSPAKVAPALVLERFLRAANSNDLKVMAQLFGTEKGSITKFEKASDVERRMFALASMLHYKDYSLKGQQIAPGRLGDAIELSVSMTLPSDRKVTVPFTMVRSSNNEWLVEKFDPDPLVSH